MVAEDWVSYTCGWCRKLNLQMRGNCICEKCGKPRGSRPPVPQIDFKARTDVLVAPGYPTTLKQK